jgi:RHS repeat-associated protein
VTQTQDPKGAVVTIAYDTAGRRSQVTSLFNNAYTRWEYDIDNGHTRNYTSVNSSMLPEEFTTKTAYTNTIVDGLGQVRLFIANHPGSIGTYLAVQYTHDKIGRVTQQSNPTEITGSGVPASDDASQPDGSGGYQFTQQTYDWKGRPLVTTYPKLHPTDQSSSIVTLTYGGCGCAGGEVTTVRDERGRQKRYTKDSLGRLAKVEELNWDGSVYATTTYVYNPLDQITSSAEQGQPRSFQYDGYGRLWKRTTPEQGTTEYNYNSDDAANWVKDARGVKATFTYNNNRHLVNTIHYDLSGVLAGQNVQATTDVSFTYDEVGNRTSMSNGVESAQYHYDMLSRMDSEQYSFDNTNWYQFSYQYNLANELTRITYPFQIAGTNVQVAYTYDAAGRVTKVRGTDGANPTTDIPTYGGVKDYAQGLAYRAFGGLKNMTYGDDTHNNKALSLSYDTRLRLTQWNIPGVLGWSYAYDKFAENSNRVTYAQNITDVLKPNGDPTLNRSYDYDQVGRLWEAHSGNEADAHVAGQPFPSQSNGPYSHSYRYNEWGNMTTRVGWGGEDGSYVNWTQSFINNRLTTNPSTGQAMQYDASGNLTSDGTQTYAYDATGQQVSASGGAAAVTQSYDGDGLRFKKVDGGVTTYYLRSSLLGGPVVAELNGSGQWTRGYIYLGGQLIAIQQGTAANSVAWVQQDPMTKSQRITDSNGTLVSTIDLDPWGGETNRSSNQAFQPHRFTTYERDGNGGDEAMMRRYHGYWMGMAQPDPYAGSYDLTDPQSFNRYSYTKNDPVNLVDPSGLFALPPPPPPSSLFGDYFPPAWMGSSSDWVGLLMPISVEGGGPQKTVPQAKNDHHTPDACGHMADVAQQQADKALRANGNDPSKALSAFDTAFSTLYAGRAMKTGIDELNLSYYGAVGRTINSYYFGETGFKQEFMDTDEDNKGANADQTHHFATFFSAGINFWLESKVHNIGDNTGDQNLGNAGYDLGAALRHDPNKLRNVGELIRSNICDSNMRGRHL